MRLPGAALLIAIGLTVLWLAINGSLDKLGNIWSYIQDKSDLPGPNERDIGNASHAGIQDFSNVHVGSVLNTIGSGSSLTNPGGMI